jgi:hypothetical protein
MALKDSRPRQVKSDINTMNGDGISYMLQVDSRSSKVKRESDE